MDPEKIASDDEAILGNPWSRRGKPKAKTSSKPKSLARLSKGTANPLNSSSSSNSSSAETMGAKAGRGGKTKRGKRGGKKNAQQQLQQATVQEYGKQATGWSFNESNGSQHPSPTPALIKLGLLRLRHQLASAIQANPP
jgi:hypothetical protein